MVLCFPPRITKKSATLPSQVTLYIDMFKKIRKRRQCLSCKDNLTMIEILRKRPLDTPLL